MQKVDIVFGELVQFINPFFKYFSYLLFLGLNNVNDNEFEKKNYCCYCRVEKLLL